jgi:hypothetical protein
MINVVWLQYNLQPGCLQCTLKLACVRTTIPDTASFGAAGTQVPLWGGTRNREIMLRGTERDTTGRCRVDQGASSARRCRNGNERASAVSLLSTALLPPTRAIHRTPRPYPHARTVPASVSVLIDPSSKNESDASFLCSLGLP